MVTKASLHRLIDELPDTELDTAERFLEYLRATSRDPLLRMLLSAADDDEPETPEEAAGMAETCDDIRAGRLISHEEARRRLLGLH